MAMGAERLLKELREAEQRSEESAAFIGHKGLGDEFAEWVLKRRAEIDKLLDESRDNGK